MVVITGRALIADQVVIVGRVVIEGRALITGRTQVTRGRAESESVISPACDRFYC